MPNFQKVRHFTKKSAVFLFYFIALEKFVMYRMATQFFDHFVIIFKTLLILLIYYI